MKDFEQQLGNLPEELLEQHRFFELYGRNKTDVPKGWSNPDNQKFLGELNCRNLIGFDTCGHGVADDYLLIDFDHVLDEKGDFINDAAKYWFETCCDIIPETYREISFSGTGIHILAKPTPDKFNPISNGKDGVLIFDDTRGSKLEIFYKNKARYCLLTGKPFKGLIRKIANGEYVDLLLETILEEIKSRQSKPAPARESIIPKTEKRLQPAQIESGSDYDLFRARRMVEVIPVADLSGAEWLACISALKNLGFSYAEVDRLNQGGAHYNERINQQRWDSLNDTSFGIETLHGIAKRFNYSEKDSTLKWYQLHPELSTVNAKKEPPKVGRTERKSSDKLKLTFEQKKFLYSGGYSDREFAERIAYLFRDEIRYLAINNEWLILERNNLGGAIWKNHGDSKSAIYPFVRRLSDALIANAEPEVKPEDGKITPEIADKMRLRSIQIGLGKRLWHHKYISPAIELLKDDPIKIKAEDLNKPKHLLNVLNGVVDLRTGELLPVDPNYLITNQANAEYNPNVDTSFVEKFFAQILPDEETRRAVLRYLGYCLTGDKPYHASHFWKGSGANGKSTVLDAVIQLLGTYVVKFPAVALLENRRPPDPNAPTPVLSQLDGDIRLAVIDELPRNARLNGSLFKTITGDATTYARPLYGNPRLVELRAKMLLNGNHLPTFDIDDKDSLKRRIHRVEYTEKFEGERADPDLPKKLSTPENRSALLKILVDEAKEFYRSGLLESDAMKSAKEEYFAESDFIADFITEQCIVGEGGEVSRKVLEERLTSEYPRECGRLKKKELFRLVTEHLEALGASYAKAHGNQNIFKNVKLIDVGKE